MYYYYTVRINFVFYLAYSYVVYIPPTQYAYVKALNSCFSTLLIVMYNRTSLIRYLWDWGYGRNADKVGLSENIEKYGCIADISIIKV